MAAEACFSSNFKVLLRMPKCPRPNAIAPDETRRTSQPPCFSLAMLNAKLRSQSQRSSPEPPFVSKDEPTFTTMR